MGAATSVGLTGYVNEQDRPEDRTTASVDQQNSDKYGGTLVYSAGDDSQKLDPHYRVSRASAQLLVHVVETLAKVNNKLEPEPFLAKNWSVSDDNKTYTFQLPKGVTFHPPVDREMTSEDVVKSLQRIKNDKQAAAHADFKPVKSISADGKYTVKVRMKRPFAPFFNTLAKDTTAILPHEYFDKMSKHPVGTGPYRFDTRQRGNFSRLTKYKNYRQKKYPYFDKIEARPISEGSVRLDELKTGDVHVATTIPPKNAKEVKNNKSLLLEQVKGLAVEEFAFNNDVKPFDNPKVRKAISHAIDKPKLIKFALRGYGDTAVTTLPPSSKFALDGQPLPQNYDKAKSLLEEAGHPNGFKTTIKLPKAYPRSVKVGIPVKQWLSQIGVDAQLQRVTWDTWISDVFGNGNFEITTVPFYSAYEPHTALYKIFHTNETFNFFNYSNKQVDKLLEKGATSLDTKTRKQAYLKAQRQIRNDLPIVLPFYRTQLYVRRDSVENRLVWGDGEMRLWHNWFANSK